MRILPYTDALASMFRTINEAWIADMFVARYGGGYARCDVAMRYPLM